MDGIFLGLAGLLLGISLGLRPWEIPRSNPAIPLKTPFIPPLIIVLTHSVYATENRLTMVSLMGKTINNTTPVTCPQHVVFCNDIDLGSKLAKST